MQKIKNIIVTLTFVLFIGVFAVLCTVNYFNPTETSESERRPLAQFPQNITWEGIVDKTVIEGFEDYSVDQFPLREFFRGIKARFQYHVLNLKENNGLAVEDGYIAKVENQFNPNFVNSSIGKLEDLYKNQILDKANNTFVSVIPDKNYYFGEKYGYPAPDYKALVEQLLAALPESKYVDIFDELELEDFYKTDTHWDQSKLLDVVAKLGAEMGFETNGSYTENKLEGFEGVYYGQSAIDPEKDTITYLTNEAINSMKLQDVSNNKFMDMYALDLFDGEDGYNVFLSGAAGNPMLRIINPKATNNKTLIVFRDSYGSSITPLIAEGYRTVYVIDIRSVNYQLLDDPKMPDGSRNPYYINFEGKDVLFLYSALVLNSTAFK